mmetsp:Transcript_39400/g.75489  ORF Transcript_39400/g.75489 Transcript_39400/m.75489 type:complete len:693 (+) Transcript_39400:128-2206(+)
MSENNRQNYFAVLDQHTCNEQEECAVEGSGENGPFPLPGNTLGNTPHLKCNGSKAQRRSSSQSDLARLPSRGNPTHSHSAGDLSANVSNGAPGQPVGSGASGKNKKRQKNTQGGSAHAQRLWRRTSVLFAAASAFASPFHATSAPPLKPATARPPAHPAAPPTTDQGAGSSHWRKASLKVRAVTRMGAALRSVATTTSARALDGAAALALRASETAVISLATTLDAQGSNFIPAQKSAAQKKWRKASVMMSATSCFKGAAQARNQRISLEMDPPSPHGVHARGDPPVSDGLHANQKKLRNAVMKIKAMNRFKLPPLSVKPDGIASNALPQEAHSSRDDGLVMKATLLRRMRRLLRSHLSEDLIKERETFLWSVQCLVVGLLVPLAVCYATNFSGVIGSMEAMRDALDAFGSSEASQVWMPEEGANEAHFHRTEASLLQWHRTLSAIHRDGLARLGGQVVTVDDMQLEFELNRKSHAKSSNNISWMFAAHLLLSMGAYLTQHAGWAVAAMVMNAPLLWLTIAVKQVDDALYDVVSMMSGHFMVFVELPMGKSAEEMTAYSITLKKMQVVSQFWQTQDLGVDVTVPGLGHLTLNLAALVSVVLASAGAVWVFSKQVRMVPYLLQGSRALLVEAAVAVHDCATQQLTKTRHSMLGKQPETQYVSSTACTSLGMANSNTSASAKSEGKKKISKRTL